MYVDDIKNDFYEALAGKVRTFYVTIFSLILVNNMYLMIYFISYENLREVQVYLKSFFNECIYDV